MIPKPDSSLKGLTVPYLDGSGWTGQDAIEARQDGWWLDIQPDIIRVKESLTFNGVEVKTDPNVPKGLAYLIQNSGTYFGKGGKIYNAPTLTPQEKTNVVHLLEKVMTGDSLAFKALYLMVFNDPEQYGDWRPTVEALKETYGTS